MKTILIRQGFMLLIFRTVILFFVGVTYVVLGIYRSYPSHLVTAVFTFVVFILSVLHHARVLKNKKVLSVSFYILGYIMMIDLLYIYQFSGFSQTDFYALISLALVLGLMFRDIAALLIFFSITMLSLIAILLIGQKGIPTQIDLVKNGILYFLLMIVYTPLLILRIRGQRTMENAVRAKTQELEQINLFLEDKVRIGIQELRNKDAMLIQQGKLSAMGEMVANIAHQWKQPLNALGVSIQNLKDYYNQGILDDEFLNKNVARSLLLIQHMAHTIDDFRDFFKPDREKKVFDLKDAAERSLSLIDASFKNHFIDVELEAAPGIKIEGYPGELCQALLNILSNAKDEFIARKMNGAKVLIRIYRENGSAVVTLSNNAGSIDEKILPRIFEPYFTTKEYGSGIGLYMTRMIVEKYAGGKVTAKNITGGAEFRIEIPLPVIVINGSHPS